MMAGSSRQLLPMVGVARRQKRREAVAAVVEEEAHQKSQQRAAEAARPQSRANCTAAGQAEAARPEAEAGAAPPAVGRSGQVPPLAVAERVSRTRAAAQGRG